MVNVCKVSRALGAHAVTVRTVREQSSFLMHADFNPYSISLGAFLFHKDKSFLQIGSEVTDLGSEAVIS
jgi:hypothetical protein